jgi:hypothetical protein
MKARPKVLPCTPPLLDWLRQDPAWSGLPRAVRARYRWSSAWGGVNARLSVGVDRGDPPSTLRDPVFVLGPWRTGSTVMHELLVAATGLPAPRTWQCMNAGAFRLSAPPLRGGATARPMDGWLVDAHAPQEDEFALLTLGVPSAYRAFLMPHRFGELLPTLSQRTWMDDPSWLAPWERFLRSVLHVERAAGLPLVLKSPNHTFRLRALLRRFPGARLAWMTRDPVEAAHSNLDMWAAMARRHGLAPMDGAGLHAFLSHAFAAAAEALDEACAALAPDRLSVVPHAALVRAPRELTRAVCARLLPERTIDEARLDERARQVDERAPRRRDEALPAELQRAAQALRRAQDDAARTHGLRA